MPRVSERCHNVREQPAEYYLCHFVIGSPSLLFRFSCASFGGLITTAFKCWRVLSEVVRADSEPVISVDLVPSLPSRHLSLPRPGLRSIEG
jgi:hypothetical protein